MPELRRLRSSAEGSLEAPLCLEFVVGCFAPPVTLGSLARAYFDGATLFLCCVSLDAAVTVDGAALSTSWAPAPCPAVVWLGDLRLDYAVVSDEPARAAPARTANPWATHTVVMNAPHVLSGPVLEPRVELSVVPNRSFETVTVIGPPPSPAVIAALAEPPAGLAPALRKASAARSQHVAETGARAPRNLMSKLRARVQEDFRRTPRNIRATLFALPIVAWAALTLGGPSEIEPWAPSKTASASTAVPKTAPETAREQTSASPTSASAATSAEPENVASASIMRGKRTLEANAADAAARGAYTESAQMYRELAVASPSRPEFAVAARILQAKGTGPR